MYYREPLQLAFKDESHEADFWFLIEKVDRPLSDREYGSLMYMIATSGKTDALLDLIDSDGVDVEILQERMGVFSSSERAMIRFGLQLFNSSIDDIKLADVFWSLDEENVKSVKSVIDYRFR